MDQSIDAKAQRTDGGGNRIDQERHVVIDHRDAGEALADPAGHRFDCDHGFAGGALARRLEHQAGSIGQALIGELAVAGKKRLAQGSGDG